MTITQEQVNEIFKQNPFYPLSVESIKHELRSEGIILNTQSVYNNLKRLVRANLVKKKGRLYYGIDNENKVNTIIQGSQVLQKESIL